MNQTWLLPCLLLLGWPNSFNIARPSQPDRQSSKWLELLNKGWTPQLSSGSESCTPFTSSPPSLLVEHSTADSLPVLFSRSLFISQTNKAPLPFSFCSYSDMTWIPLCLATPGISNSAQFYQCDQKFRSRFMKCVSYSSQSTKTYGQMCHSDS
jgi:hypothetical protein